MKDIPHLKETGLSIRRREEMDLLQMVPSSSDLKNMWTSDTPGHTNKAT